MHYCYGWPCGGSVDYPDEQVYQDRSWGQYLSFRLEDLEPGEYVTVDGRLTPLAVRYLAQASGKYALLSSSAGITTQIVAGDVGCPGAHE
ncbi:MAG: hypothetical protein IH868_11450 [Chloroflexi bacterium]|nr:hypothetical protein [Chloroflexota bacterium]